MVNIAYDNSCLCFFIFILLHWLKLDKKSVGIFGWDGDKKLQGNFENVHKKIVCFCEIGNIAERHICCTLTIWKKNCFFTAINTAHMH